MPEATVGCECVEEKKKKSHFWTGFEQAGLCRCPDVDDEVWHLLPSGLKVIVGKYWDPQEPRSGRNSLA